MIDHSQACAIMRGYMAPRNNAINVFAQTGVIWKDSDNAPGVLIDEINGEIMLVEKELNTDDYERRGELITMLNELNYVYDYVSIHCELSR